MAVLLVAALGAIIAYRDNNLPFLFDLAFLGELVEHRSAFWNVPAFVMNNIGGGTPGVKYAPGERMRLVADATFHILGKRTLIKAEEDIKLKGDKIHLG